MKRKVIAVALSIVFLFMIPVFGQHPLVGTWKMVSIKGRGADGEQFSLDTTSVREIKVITPTHYMLMAYTVDGDSLIFNRSYAGTVSFDKERYLEKPEFSSLPLFDNVKSNYTWKVEGNHFIQSGSFTRPDGKTIFLDELIFERVGGASINSNNPTIGTWRLQSSLLRAASGIETKLSNGFQIVTPTHWMQILYNNNKFSQAVMGTYEMRNGKVYPKIELVSSEAFRFQNLEIDQYVKNHTLTQNLSGNVLNEKFSCTQTFEKQ